MPQYAIDRPRGERGIVGGHQARAHVVKTLTLDASNHDIDHRVVDIEREDPTFSPHGARQIREEIAGTGAEIDDRHAGGAAEELDDPFGLLPPVTLLGVHPGGVVLGIGEPRRRRGRGMLRG